MKGPVPLTEPGVTIVNPQAGVQSERSWQELRESAGQLALTLCNTGVSARPRLLSIQRVSLEQVVALLAPGILEGSISVAPLLERPDGRLAGFTAVRNAIAAVRPQVIVADDDVIPLLHLASLDAHLVPTSQIGQALGQSKAEPTSVASQPVQPGADAILQLTSGSSGLPRCVAISREALEFNLHAITQRLVVTSSDVIVSWLPLYHDMGLVGQFLLADHANAPLVLLSPIAFALDSSCWLETISDFGGTISAAPNFAFGATMRAMALTRGDLSCWRAAVCGGEPIDVLMLAEFARAAAKHGFDSRSFACSYGLAEATLAVTIPEPGSGLQTDYRDLGAGGVQERALLGMPLSGVELEVRAAHGSRGGDIWVRTPSLARAFMTGGIVTDELEPGSWFSTGDVGYVVDENLVVAGRSKDMIIIGGRNVFPDEVETRVAAITGALPGRVACVGIERRGTQASVVVVESDPMVEMEPSELRQRIRRTVVDELGIPLASVEVWEPGEIPRTSSGKIQRHLVKQVFEAGEQRLRGG